MLLELAVSDLGVIADIRLVLGPGMTALTGETGAGKTMLVEAVELLVGARADASVVRPGATEATVEGRFELDGEEVVLCRVIPRDGRSRAYVNGRLAPVAGLADWGSRLVDLHGQHAHQSLLGTAAQRAALDRYGEVDLTDLADARAELTAIEAALAAIGGDERARAREVDLLRFQVAELEAAGLDDVEEDPRLEAEEDRLADATGHREAAARAADALSSDGSLADALASALIAVAGRSPFAEPEKRLRGLAVELNDVASEIRSAGEAIDDDPERLEAVRQRRHLLRELCRKYGDTLAEVISYGREAGERLAALEAHDERAAALGRDREEAKFRLAVVAACVARARRDAAPRLAEAVQRHFAGLALGKAKLAVDVGATDPGDDVAFLLAANPGAPLLPLTKVASGGELARTMLAVRLVLAGTDAAGGGPPTLVFDEVDAGIGGRTAISVGQALAALALDRQVFVVTHLPQVAAFADAQVAITKRDDGRTTVAAAQVLNGSDRVIELSRMLSGTPESATAREHAAELLASAARERSNASVTPLRKRVG